MNKLRAMFTSHPYISNVVGYTSLFATADLIQQSMLGDTQCKSTKPCGKNPEDALSTSGEKTSMPSNLEDKTYSCKEPKDSLEGNNGILVFNIDWGQTTRVALVGLCFHSNFNYHWLRTLEKTFPGGGFKRISLKVFLDQLIAAPATISAFYIGLSTLEEGKNPLEDWKNKFWTSYQTGIIYWSIMQAVNFSLVPPVARTVFVGGISLCWTVFLCHFRQQKK